MVDVSLTGITPAWRPETGCLFFGEREEYYFAWLPSVPQGDAQVTMAVDEVAAFAQVLTHLGLLKSIQEPVLFARALGNALCL